MITASCFILGLFILASTGLLCFTITSIDKSAMRRHATMSCLLELVDVLNEHFPGSDLKVVDNTNKVKVIGELKYNKSDE